MSEKPNEKNSESAPTDAGLRAYQVLSDTPSATADKDHLNFKPYATALATLIDRKATSTPLIAAISAPWGAGKTTLSELVQGQLRVFGEWDDHHIICRFNAWKHDDAPNLGSAFAAEVAQRANRDRRWWRKLLQPLPLTMLRPEQRWRRKCYVILISLTVAIALVAGTKTRGLITAASHPSNANWTAAERASHGWAATILIILAALAFIYPKIFAGTQAVARFISDPQSEAAQGSMNEVRDQLRRLIHSATRGRRRFIIFVDDLERCRPPRAVEVCEVASQLLDHPSVITVLVGDMDAIAMSAAIKYRSLEFPGNDPPDNEVLRAAYSQYGRTYLQKIVTIQFDLPPATPDQLKDMLRAAARTPATVDQSAATRLRHALIQYTNAIRSYIKAGLSSIKLKLTTVDLRKRVERVILGVGILLGLAGIAYTVFIFVTSARSASLLSSVATIGAAVAAVAGIIPLAVDYTRRRRTRATRTRIGQAIQDQAAGMTADEAVENILLKDTGSSAGSVRRAFLSVVLDTTGIASRADALVFDFLPDRPRAAKRLLNQVRLMVLIATDRGLFVRQNTKDQNQRADRIGKWLVLRERWPDIVKVVQRDPDKMRNLERAASSGNVRTLESQLRHYNIGDTDDVKDLSRLLNRPPHFGDLRELTFFSGVPEVAGGKVTKPVPDNGSKDGRPARTMQPRRSRNITEVDPEAPPAPPDRVTVKRVASNAGVISVAGQKIALGRSHARQVVAVHVSADTITIDLTDDDVRTVHRTTTQLPQNIKGQDSRRAVGVP